MSWIDLGPVTDIPLRGARKLKTLFEEGRAHMIGTSGTITSIEFNGLDITAHGESAYDHVS